MAQSLPSLIQAEGFAETLGYAGVVQYLECHGSVGAGNFGQLHH